MNEKKRRRRKAIGIKRRRKFGRGGRGKIFARV